MEGKSSSNMFLVAIVAVVAIVGLVVLYLYVTAPPSEVYYVDEEGNVVSDAVTGQAGRLAGERLRLRPSRIPAPDSTINEEGKILIRGLPCPDADKDGFPLEYNAEMAEVKPFMNACKGVGSDCDDKNPLVNPKAKEVCNGIDDNCDGNIDKMVVVRGRTTSVEDVCPVQQKCTVSVTAPDGKQLCCIDSDGGNNPLVGGTTTSTGRGLNQGIASDVTVSDTCLSNTILNDTFCSPTQVDPNPNWPITYPGNIVSGRLNDCAAQGLVCIDPDGPQDPFGKGTMPAYCGTTPPSKAELCLIRDANGVCVCSSTDNGDDPLVGGTLTMKEPSSWGGRTINISDRCSGSPVNNAFVLNETRCLALGDGTSRANDLQIDCSLQGKICIDPDGPDPYFAYANIPAYCGTPSQVTCLDADKDGFQNPNSSAGCTLTTQADCNDMNSFIAPTLPYDECNNVDNNCDGIVDGNTVADEFCPTCTDSDNGNNPRTPGSATYSAFDIITRTTYTSTVAEGCDMNATQPYYEVYCRSYWAGGSEARTNTGGSCLDFGLRCIDPDGIAGQTPGYCG